MKKKFFLTIIFLNFYFAKAIDLTIVGNISMGDGLGKVGINFIESLKNKCSINWLSSQGLEPDLKDIPNDIINIIKNKDKSSGKITILTDIPWCKYGTFANNVSDDSLIKIAYSMLETNKIPIEWVNIFNNKFDLVVVPDQYYANVYKDSGVVIPIFVLPIIMDLKKFYNFSKIEPKRNNRSLLKPTNNSLKKRIGKVGKVSREIAYNEIVEFGKNSNDIFTFGNTSSIWPHKNVELLIKAFGIAFSNNKNVRLLINSRHVEPGNNLAEALAYSNNALIEFTSKKLNEDALLNFLSKIDCYVSFSKGEGFSLCPRECLAMNIPCIISNNTAHINICDTGFVRSVDSNLLVKATYSHLPSDTGFQFDTKLEDAVSALLDVYNNYKHYKKLAMSSRNWLDQYSFDNLKGKYINLICPKKLLFGDENKITNNYLITNSESLYKKYLIIKEIL